MSRELPERTAGAAEGYRDPHAPLEQRVDCLMERLTLDEKISLLAGASMMELNAVPRLGVPALKMTDGPTGVRSQEGAKATVFPVGVAIAASWNPELAHEVGAAIAREARALGAHVLLAPTVNIVRTPRWGRSFETYSEDPFLAGAIGTDYVKGVQSEGIGASLKHFAVNNQETNRFTVSADVDERTLHEIYLPAFETVVKEARPWSVMASYNKINGTYACENRHLLTDLLKTGWNYDGMVVSDWGAVHSTAPTVNAGLDLEMPGPAKHLGARLRQAVDEGKVEVAQIDDNARRLVRLILRAGLLDGAPPRPGELGGARHRDIARRAAEEAIVLLKNDGLLPLDPKIRRLAVIGPNADISRVQGGGSSQVNPLESATPLEALRQALPDIEIVFAQGVDSEDTPPAARPALFSPTEDRSQSGLAAAYFAGADFDAKPVRTAVETAFEQFLSDNLPASTGYAALRWEGFFWPPASGRYEFAVRGTGAPTVRCDGRTILDPDTDFVSDPRDVLGFPVPRRDGSVELEAGRGYPIRLDYVLGLTPFELLRFGVREPEPSIEEAVEAASNADAAILFVGSASKTEGEGYDRDTLSLPGRQDALVSAVLAANPRSVVVINAGAAMTMPWVENAPAIVDMWLPGQEGPHALADILFGKVNPSGKLPVTFPKRDEDDPTFHSFPGGQNAEYSEGQFIGYRAFDSKGVAPLFAFGHGLSYASFTYSDLSVPSAVTLGEPVTVRLRVQNCGRMPGKEVVQLYLQPPAAPDRPLRQLAGFRKVEIAPGETQSIELLLPVRAFATYDPACQDWIGIPGVFHLLIGGSSSDIRLSATIDVVVAEGY